MYEFSGWTNLRQIVPRMKAHEKGVLQSKNSWHIFKDFKRLALE
jgi:hypothetical protein